MQYFISFERLILSFVAFDQADLFGVAGNARRNSIDSFQTSKLSNSNWDI